MAGAPGRVLPCTRLPTCLASRHACPQLEAYMRTQLRSNFQLPMSN